MRPRCQRGASAATQSDHRARRRGAVLFPFVSVYLRETTGSFITAFMLIPLILLTSAAIIWFYSPEHARKELDAISD